MLYATPSVRAVMTSALPAYTASRPPSPAVRPYALAPQNISYVLTANAPGAFPLPDGVSLNVGDAVLVTSLGAAAALDVGVYTLISPGSASTPWCLTSKWQGFAKSPLFSGEDIAFDPSGAPWGPCSETWRLVTPDPIVIGSTSLVFYPHSFRAAPVDLVAGSASFSGLWLAPGADVTPIYAGALSPGTLQVSASASGPGTGTATVTSSDDADTAPVALVITNW